MEQIASGRLCVSAILTLLLISTSNSAEDMGNLWHRVTVSLRRLQKVPRQEAFRHGLLLLPQMACPPYCSGLGWCRLWCLSPDSFSCLLFEATVSTSYVETNLADALQCYTATKGGLMGGATVTSSPAIGVRKATNLVDGLYLGNELECFRSEKDENPWLLFDLGSVKTIRRVLITMISDSKEMKNQVPYEVRVGTETVTPPFLDAYQLIGHFETPSEPGAVLVAEPVNVVSGRYITIQIARNVGLGLCHVEVE